MFDLSALWLVCQVFGVAARLLLAAALLALNGPQLAERSSEALILDRYAQWHGSSNAETIETLSYDFELWDKGKIYFVKFFGARDGRVRVDAYDNDQYLISEGVDGAGGWTCRRKAKAPGLASAEGAAALRHGLALNALFLNQLAELGHKIERHPVGEKPSEVGLRVTLDDGFQSLLYLDADTGKLVRKLDRSSLHPDVDPAERWFETRFFDYVDVHGLKFWSRSETRDVESGEIVQKISRNNFSINGENAHHLNRSCVR